MRILTLAPDEPGFKLYTSSLLKAYAQDTDHQALDPLWYEENLDQDRLAKQAQLAHPDLIHIHHEYGSMGSKLPHKYGFPLLMEKLRESLPQTRVVATAHTVIRPEFRYPLEGRGWQIPLRILANTFLRPALLKLWIEGTWGDLDGVIVHSRHQLPAVRSSGCPRCVEIPHQVYHQESTVKANPQKPIKLLVFGYLTPEKGQDVAIQAMAHLPDHVHLVLAGGVRRPEDQGYMNHCQDLIKKLKLQDRVTITGFVLPEDMDGYYQEASLVIIPFRETSGSGSIVHALGRGAPILASNHELNAEIQERVPNALALFKNGDPVDLNAQIEACLEPNRLEELRKGALEYAERYSTDNVAKLHLRFFERVLGVLNL